MKYHMTFLWNYLANPAVHGGLKIVVNFVNKVEMNPAKNNLPKMVKIPKSKTTAKLAVPTYSPKILPKKPEGIRKINTEYMQQKM